MSVPETLRKAAALIQKRGWCQRVREDEDGCLCVLGAIAVAAHGYAEETVDEDLSEPVRALLPDPAERIWHWNDAPGRTAGEVIALLEKAATMAEAAP